MFKAKYVYSDGSRRETIDQGSLVEMRRYRDWYERKHNCTVEIVGPDGKIWK